MNINVYNGEIYDKGKTWYVIFISILVIFFVYSFIKKNFVGIIIMILILGGYLFLNITNRKILNIKIDEDGLWIDDKFYPYNQFEGFMVELDERNNYKNIIFIRNQIPYIFTFTEKNSGKISKFVSTLAQKIPYLSDIDLGFINKLLRFLKI